MNRLRRLWCLLLPLPLAAEGLAQEKGIRIGYTNAVAAANYPPALREEAAKLKWYFAHASVGENMMGGILDLRSLDKSAFPIQSIAAQMPPGDPQAGVIYEHNRGNPGWQAKFDGFAKSVSNGWHFPKVDVVMNKLCYIDQTASFKYYLHSMTNLESAFPQTVFVYLTMPLMSSSDNENYLRHVFNDRLRAWAAQNGKVLFDIADIEAHDSSGPSTFTYRGKTCQRLCDKYTTDGGHLNEAGRKLVAQGFYALAAELQKRPTQATR